MNQSTHLLTHDHLIHDDTCPPCWMFQKKHVPICQKTVSKRRKVFDSSRQRAEGTDISTLKPIKSKVRTHWHHIKRILRVRSCRMWFSLLEAYLCVLKNWLCGDQQVRRTLWFSVWSQKHLVYLLIVVPRAQVLCVALTTNKRQQEDKAKKTVLLLFNGFESSLLGNTGKHFPLLRPIIEVFCKRGMVQNNQDSDSFFRHAKYETTWNMLKPLLIMFQLHSSTSSSKSDKVSLI